MSLKSSMDKLDEAACGVDQTELARAIAAADEETIRQYILILARARDWIEQVGHSIEQKQRGASRAPKASPVPKPPPSTEVLFPSREDPGWRTYYIRRPQGARAQEEPNE